ncbi:uncharacterized protein METZ01_LOCUS409037, partial [marine metagenome]
VGVGGPCAFDGCKRKHMYNSLVCYKHKGQKPPLPPSVKETEPTPSKDLWWTEDDET